MIIIRIATEFVKQRLNYNEYPQSKHCKCHPSYLATGIAADRDDVTGPDKEVITGGEREDVTTGAAGGKAVEKTEDKVEHLEPTEPQFSQVRTGVSHYCTGCYQINCVSVYVSGLT